MANDSEVMRYDVNSVLSYDLFLVTRIYNDVWWFDTKLSLCRTKSDERLIRGIERCFTNELNLPSKRSMLIRSTERKNTLSVDCQFSSNLLFHTYLPINKKYKITMTIDENGIFDVDVKVLEKLSKSQNFKKYSIPQNIDVTNDDKFYVVGIDLGTTRCCAAVNRKNGVETVALESIGGRLLPSFVAFEDNKQEVCGEVKRLQTRPKSIVFDAKRIIGRQFDDIITDPNWPFKVIHNEKHKINYFTGDHAILLKILDRTDTFIKIHTSKNELLKYPEEILTALLKYIKQKIQYFAGSVKKNVTITVPATFTDAQKDATSVAALLAEWQYVDLLPEPVAAAIAYFVDTPTEDNFIFLLFDLGGGTLNVCIFKCERRQIEIVCQNGNSNLGGRDFDNILVEHFTLKLQSEYGITNLAQKKYKLMQNCQEIKEFLSVNSEACLSVDDFDISIEEFINITRQEFESLSINLLAKIETCINETFYNSDFKHDDIDKVLFVGGGSRMPMTRNLLQSMFPKAEKCCPEHPDESVAVGALYYAYYMKSLLHCKRDEKLQPLKHKNRKRKIENKVIFDKEKYEKLLKAATSNMKNLQISSTTTPTTSTIPSNKLSSTFLSTFDNNATQESKPKPANIKLSETKK